MNARPGPVGWMGAALAFSLLVLSCGPEGRPLAGGTGIETTNGVTGAVFKEGSPVQGARVALYPENFDPYRDTLPDTLRDNTDSHGRYEIRGIPIGRYNLFAEGGPGGISTMILGVPVVGKGATRLPEKRLLAPGAIRIPRGGGVAEGAGYVYIPGSPWIVSTHDEESGLDYVLLEGVAAADYPRLRFVDTENGLATDILGDTLRVSPGDTIKVNPFLAWAGSRSLHFITSSRGAGVSETILGFPILVRLDSSRFDFSKAQSGGGDIRFAKPDGMPLPYQIERWDAAARQAEIWVRVDTLKGDSESGSMRMYWGKPDAVDASDAYKVFSMADGFAGVWHLSGESDTSVKIGAHRNSVQDADHGDDHLMTVDLGGVVGNGRGFDGNGYIRIGDPGAGLRPQRNITVSGWYKASVADTAGAMLATLGDSYGLKMDENGKTRLFVYVDTAHVSPLTAVSILDGRWHHVAGSYDGTSVRSYVDGVFLDSVNISGPIGYTLGKEFLIGKHGNGKANVDAMGNIDEIQVSASTRSRAWIKLSFENQKADASWIEFGD